MAKGRRPARAKRHPASRPPASGADPEAAGTSGDELADRLANLKAEVSDARSEAVSRAREAGTQSESEADAAPPAPEPRVAEHGRRNRAAVLVATLAAVGVLIGLIVAGRSGSKGAPAPVASYLQANVPEGTPVGVVPGSESAVPKGYPVVAVGSTDSLKNLKYAVGPDPIARAGLQLSTWFGGHGTVVANNPGKASLYMVAAGTVVPTSVAPSTVPPSTAPVTTTAPATTSPPTSQPPTTLPPPTTTPPAPTPPPSAAPPPNAPGGPAGQVKVEPGDSFWSIAAQIVQQRLGHPPTTAQVAHYWARVVAANSGRLVQAGNPNLIYPGQMFVLPAG